jgi:HAE1 family hydrophobic/amphiphilic exporter-1
MKLAELSVKRGVTSAMIFLVAAGFGLFSLARLRLDLYPDISFPMVAVITEYQGAGPREIEDLITRPIEGAVTSVEGAKKVRSTSKQGVSLVQVEFPWGADLKQAEIDVRKYIDFLRGVLPEDARAPLIFALNPSLQPIVFMNVTGPYPETKLREIAEEKIEPLIERVHGVATVDTAGTGKREIQVRVDPRRLARAGIAAQQLVAALRAENVQLPSGSFEQGDWEFTIQTRGKYTSLAQIENTVIGMRQGSPIRVRDVATVHDTLVEETRLVRTDGRPGLMMMVRKQSDANTVQVVRAVKRALPEIERKAGRDIRARILFDQGEIVEKSIGNLGSTGLQAVALTFLVLLFFLRSFRPSLIVAVSIPLSVVVAFSAMDALGLTLNIISMSGLALAVGMLVDNSIVVQEAIFLRAEAGAAPRVAAIEGAQEVGMAITASTLTTLVVFLPILFVPGIAGQIFRDMSITVCVSLTISLLVALTAVPLASSRMLARRAARAPAAPRREGPVGRGLGATHRLIERSYARSLGWCLRHRKKVFALVTLAFLAALALAVRLPRNFFPRQDTGLTIMQLEGPVGASLAASDTSFRRVEKIIEQTIPERKTVNLDLGAGEGFVALFMKGSHAGIVRLKLKDRAERKRTQMQIEDDLSARLARLPGVTATVFRGGLMGSEGDIVVEIYCHDLVEARAVGLAVKDLLRRVPGTADVSFSLEAGKPEYEVVLDRARLAALGLNAAAVSGTISTIFGGKLAGSYLERGYEYDIRVRGPRSFRLDEHNLRTSPIATPAGQSVPLAAVARIGPAVGPATITRQDQQRMVTVAAAVPGKDLGSVLADVKARLERFPWPEGTTHRIGGAAEDFQDSFRYLGLALFAAILLVYMVMASQFESLLHPFLILFTIPLALIGMVAALQATDTPLSVTALIGGLILVGIVVNNGIILVDHINQLRAEGRELAQAVIDGARRRLRPVLMTAGTTVLGMLPLALEIGEGSEGWAPMARAIIGGLTVSTALTLLVIPALYLSVESLRERWRAWLGRRRSALA